MTNEEAIKYLSVHMMNLEFTLDYDQVFDAIDIAIKALEKQIPKKPIYKTFVTGDTVAFECPTCHKHNLDDGKLFGDCCPYCGQAIDWSK